MGKSGYSQINEDIIGQLSEWTIDYFYRDELEVTMSDPKEVQYFKENAFDLHLYVFQMVANACYRVKSNEIRETFVCLLNKAPTRAHRCSCGGALAHLGDPLGYKVLGEFIDDPLPLDDDEVWLTFSGTLILLHTPQAMEMLRRQRTDFRVPKDIRNLASEMVSVWDTFDPVGYY